MQLNVNMDMDYGLINVIGALVLKFFKNDMKTRFKVFQEWTTPNEL